MIEAAKVNSAMVESLQRFGKEYKVAPKEVQVVFKIKSVGEGEEQGYQQAYSTLVDYEEKEADVTIEKLLGIKSMLGVSLDPFNLCQIVPTFIVAALDCIVDDEDIEPKNIKILVTHNGKEKKEAIAEIHLYDDEAYKRKMDFSEIVDQSKLMRFVNKYNIGV